MERIAGQPFLGKRTDDPAIRRLATVPYPYLIFYEAADEEIIVHAVRHGARSPCQVNHRHSIIRIYGKKAGFDGWWHGEGRGGEKTGAGEDEAAACRRLARHADRRSGGAALRIAADPDLAAEVQDDRQCQHRRCRGQLPEMAGHLA
ncbi:type II toxin-antitoxin system RelE/ParE family toxin [Mesorhizobium sp. Cs1299R1N3]